MYGLNSNENQNVCEALSSWEYSKISKSRFNNIYFLNCIYYLIMWHEQSFQQRYRFKIYDLEEYSV